ncbi:MAG: AEC family transporter [Rhodobacteraceae bacterium]|jgi:predicted permease|nr:AEC family transporter [Paracoccaceae bacterium]
MIFLTVLEIVAPVFILAGIGFTWVKIGLEYRVEFVTRFAMMMAVPCLIFTALMKTEIEPVALSELMLAGIATYAAVCVLAFIFTRVFQLDIRTYLMPLISGNTGNLGLPLCLFAFGQAGFGYAVVVFAITNILAFTLGVWVVAGGGSYKRLFQEPLVAGTFLGLLFMWQGWETPRFLTNALELIGQMAIPMMLITLGVAVARLRSGQMSRAIWISLSKVAIGAGSAAMVGLAFGLPHEALAVLVLQLSMPVAVTSYLLAEKYGADADAVAGLVVVSTLMTIGITPVILTVLIG